MDDPSQVIGNVLIVYTFLISLAFCVSYQLYAKWTATDFGRSLMLYQIAMTLILGFVAIRVIGIDTGPVIRLTVFAVVPLALTWRLIVLIKIQRLSRRARKENHE